LAVPERPPKPGPGSPRRSFGAPRGSADEDERTNIAGPPGAGAPSLTGGPDREYRSGEIEPSQVVQSPAVFEPDWEEKTVVDDGQLYSAKDGPNTASIGTITGDDELTIDEPHRPVSGLRPKPMPQRPAAPVTPTPAARVPDAVRGKLVVVAGNDTGRDYPLLGKTITVGRGIDNDVVLTDIAVSRKHLSISFDGSRYHLNDKGSGNGTIINQRVETGTRPLSHGDRIEIGNTIFRFEHPASEKEAWAAGAPAVPAPQPKIPSSGHRAPLPPPKSTSGGHPPPPPLPAPPTASPPGPASLPVPPSLPLPGSPDSRGAALPPPQDLTPAPPTTIPGPGFVDPAFDIPRPELQPQSPPAEAPYFAPPAGAPSAAPAIAAQPAHVPFVPRAPTDARKLMIGFAATIVGLIGIAVGGLFLGDDASMVRSAQPPVHIEELVLPLIVPLLELGSPPAAVTPSVDPAAATAPSVAPAAAVAPSVDPAAATAPSVAPAAPGDTIAPAP
jgi:hypothetical protein